MLIYHEISIPCEMCDKKFLSVSSFKKHLFKGHHSIFNVQCSYCGISKSNKEKLQHHIDVEHLEDVLCPECALQFKSQVSLKAHIRREHKPNDLIKCIHCSYKCPTRIEMKSHFRRRHTNDTKATCQYCGEVFKELKKHLKRTGCGGENIKPDKIKCETCQKEFTTKQAHDKHLKTIHRGVKDRICSRCSYATYSNFNLKLHFSKVHIGQKDLEKESCPYCFKVSTNLKHHIEIKHSETNVSVLGS